MTELASEAFVTSRATLSVDEKWRLTQLEDGSGLRLRRRRSWPEPDRVAIAEAEARGGDRRRPHGDPSVLPAPSPLRLSCNHARSRVCSIDPTPLEGNRAKHDARRATAHQRHHSTRRANLLREEGLHRLTRRVAEATFFQISKLRSASPPR